MKASVSPWIVLVAGLVLAGCASAKLGIESAIYSEEPAETTLLTANERLQIETGIESAEKAAVEITEGRIAVTTELNETVVAYRHFIDLIAFGILPANNKLEGLEFIGPGHQAFVEVLSLQRQVVEANVGRSREALAKYNELADRLAGGEVAAPGDLKRTRDRLDGTLIALRQSVERLGGDLGTSYESDMGEFLKGAPGALSPVNLEVLADETLVDPQVMQSVPDTAKALAKQFLELAARFQELEQKGFATANLISERLQRAAGDLTQLSATDPNMPQAAMRAEVLAETSTSRGVFIGVGPNTGLGDDGLRAIGLLTVSYQRYLSQIDRLQNAADPVWREITDPANESKWNPVFSRTLFYAEGKTSVIVVRDRPGHYRTMQGTNNPTALVQGQLRITRTIAAGLTQVIAATTGAAGLSGLLPEGEPGAADGGGTPPTESSTLAASDAAVRADAQRRQNIRLNLLRNLERLEDGLAALPDGDPRVAELTAQLQAILKGHQPLLEPQ